MEVKLNLKNATLWISDGKLTLAAFRNYDDYQFEQIIIDEVIADIKAVARLFLGVEDIPEIFEKKCDDISIQWTGFDKYVLTVEVNGEEERYTLKG